ncbi:HAMP domain-containing sensor histidine kinase [uncultured Bacteroides sp.]|uniref:sensor histidine kinase n=1 Tax=uncultured Bacteroides sp. TaxID=162156 RepID=UPI0025E013AA|nr:HAMP domain-containing sensor histidine kinase [uncultured Bacteroides sp.]
MKRAWRISLLFGLILLLGGNFYAVSANTVKPDREILILNSINFNLPWSKHFYWCVHDVLQEKGVTVKSESLSVPALVDVVEVGAIIAHLREKYPTPPTAVVIIGDPGWMVCRELFDSVWKDVPVVISNARDRLPASLEVLFSHAPLTETNSVPAEEWRRGYNITTLKQYYYIKETIELIYQLIPDMKRLAFISDDRYISEETRQDMIQTVDKHFPKLSLEQLTTTQLSTEMLLDTLHSYNDNTGIIYYSWFESHNKEDNNYLFDHIQDIISNFTPSPLFLLSSEDLSNNTFAGGCYVSAESFGQSLLEVLYRILDGEEARDIAATTGGIASTYLCYPVLKEHNIPSYRYPGNAVYVNKPRSFLQKYYIEIIVCAALIFVLAVAIFYYIRILRKAYARLSEAMVKAEQANQLKSAFLANMSHEIRTPLNAIVGFSNMLPEVDDRKEMCEYAEIIQTNTDLLLQLINDILDMSKIEAGTFDFCPTLIDVNQTLEEIEQSMQLRLKNDAVTFAFTERLPECVLYIDKNRLIQLLSNFATNAIKFTESGTISMGYHFIDTDTIYFFVSDTGRGMSKEQCEHVFERFVKYNPFIQGTGLGLSICRMIVERLEGEIGVDSKEGKGATFWFTLPYRKE